MEDTKVLSQARCRTFNFGGKASKERGERWKRFNLGLPYPFCGISSVPEDRAKERSIIHEIVECVNEKLGCRKDVIELLWGYLSGMGAGKG